MIHPSSIVVSREHRRAKTDRLDTELLMRAFLGWLRGEPRHCTMAAVPTIDEEDARRPSREREKLVSERTRIVNRMQRCAIYTRKSTEHNLDLEFNSLDAQREACEAYIKSHGRAIGPSGGYGTGSEVMRRITVLIAGGIIGVSYEAS